MRRAAPAQGRRSCGLKQYWQKCVSAQFDPCGHSGILYSAIPHSRILHSGIPKNRKSVQIATFLRLRTVALPSISNIGVKAQETSHATTRFRFTGTEKESPIEKKLQKYPNFCFCNGQTTETKQIRENYPINVEWRLNAKLKGAAIQRPNAKLRGAAIHLGPAHPGRLPPSIQITPTG